MSMESDRIELEHSSQFTSSELERIWGFAFEGGREWDLARERWEMKDCEAEAGNPQRQL